MGVPDQRYHKSLSRLMASSARIDELSIERRGELYRALALEWVVAWLFSG